MRCVMKRWAAGSAVAVLALATAARASDCGVTSVGFIPINDLGAGLYLGQFEGGLYPGGVNQPPPAHAAEGLARSEGMQPLDTTGAPSPTGKIVMLSIGMSNTTQEFCSGGGGEPCNSWTFMGQAAADPRVDHDTLVLVNGARGGQAATSWDSPTDSNYDRVRDEVLPLKGLTEAQVQIVWVKQANPGPTSSLPNANADAYNLKRSLGDISRSVKIRYPNCKIIFFSSRIYAGYASTTLNPEPYAYETALSVKWLIEAQINQAADGTFDPVAGDVNYNTVVPWLAWGPYLWADGLMPRSDGLTWECSDFEGDGTHPATSAETKVGTMLLDFMLSSPFSAPWFQSGVTPSGDGDCDDDGDVDRSDFGGLAGCFSGPGGTPGAGCECVDFDGDGDSDLIDVAAFQRAFTVAAPVFAADDFERATLGGNWLVVSGSPGIVNSSDLGPLAGTLNRLAWQGSVFTSDQFCEVEMSSNWTTPTSIQVSVRYNVQNGSNYGFRITSSGQAILIREASGGGTTLASTPGITLSPGDRLRIEAEGTAIRGKINGQIVLAGTDAMLTGGAAGMAFAVEGATQVPVMESWSGGDL